jgi:phosphoribosylaminoimidazole carboxylase (NCAIR synthetase)
VTPRDQKTASKIIEEAEYQDPSLLVEDAAQYEDEVARVVARQKAELLGGEK